MSGKKRSEKTFRKPPLRIFPTTLWSYPSQHYGESMQGDKRYVGATPSWVIWQTLQRYTREKDLVVDPMCGSGTTLLVAARTDRHFIGGDQSDVAIDTTRRRLDTAKISYTFTPLPPHQG